MKICKPAKQSDKHSWIWLCANCSAEYATDVEAMECCGEPIPNTEPDTQDIQIGGDHYRTKAVQPWDAMEAWLTKEQFAGFLRGNAIKYLARAGSKGDAVVDYQKARHYLDKLIGVLEND